MISLKSVTFGSDAEVFLKSLAGAPIPVCGMVGGTKDNPKPLRPDVMKGFFIQEDNAALEYNIPAEHSRTNFIANMVAAQREIKKLLGKAFELDYERASVVFQDEYLQIPEMGVFGCEPDYNAWKMTTNDAPRPPVPGFRSASAHIHIGWDDPNDEDRFELIRLSDTFVVLPALKRENETDTQRRQLYGKAGAFRPKGYGIEHRVLSNRWIANQGEMHRTLCDYQTAIAALNAGVKISEGDYDKVQEAINTPQTKLAELLYKKYVDKLYSVLPKSFRWSDYFDIFA